MANLSKATEFNIYVLGNSNIDDSNIEGKAYIGNNAIFNNVNVGSALEVSETVDTLIVRENMNISGGINYSGNSTYGLSGNVVEYTMVNENGVENPIEKDYTDLFNSNSLYECLSTKYGEIEANGTVTLSGATMYLEGTDENLNVFEFDAKKINGGNLSLDSLNGIVVVVPTDSTVLINVRGTVCNFNDYPLYKNYLPVGDKSGITWLWNFPDATNVNLQSISLVGSILAPFARVDSFAAKVSGNLISKRLTGSITMLNNPFTGVLPDEDCTTTTSTTTTTTTTSSTSSTSSTSTTTYCTGYCDIVKSISKEEEAIALILAAEAHKIEKILNITDDVNSIMDINESVNKMIKNISELELILKDKLVIVKCENCN